MRGRIIRWALPVALVAVIGAGAAMAATAAMRSSTPSVKTVHNAKFGVMLVSSTGRTLYRYTVDSKGVNRCSRVAICAKTWHPLVVKSGVKPTGGTGVNASMLGTITAAHSMRQVTYAGFPLYFFTGDTKAGQTNGQGFQSQWYVVNTKGALVKHAVSTSGGTSTTPGYKAPTTTSGSSWG